MMISRSWIRWQKKKDENKKAKKVLDSAFTKDVNPFKDMEAKEQVIEFIKTVLKPVNEDLIYKISVDDPEKTHWRHRDHFVKTFNFEIKHVEEYYSLSKGEKHFLQDLGEFLMWQTNLLVDEEDNPLNQTQIAERLDVNVRTVQRNMKALEERKIIHKIQIWNEAFYLVNPYVMFIGQNINISIPKLFDELGYVNSSMLGETRSDRKKEQQKRITVG